MEEEKRDSKIMLFLMTYGWAILAAIIAIGVLAYFGVFSNPINKNCFESQAKIYCLQNNMTYVDNDLFQYSFRCEKTSSTQDDYRNFGVFKRPVYYYLPEEIDYCKK